MTINNMVILVVKFHNEGYKNSNVLSTNGANSDHMTRKISPLYFNKKKSGNLLQCTANVYRELQGLYREIGVQGFQIYGDCMYTCNPCNF